MKHAGRLLVAIERCITQPGSPHDGVFIPNFRNPSSLSSADGIWINSVSGEISGFEICTDKSFFQDPNTQSELFSETSPWRQYCNHFWLVIGEEAIVSSALQSAPKDWGIAIAPSPSVNPTMKIIRDAPKLHPPDKSSSLGKIVQHLVKRRFYGRPLPSTSV